MNAYDELSQADSAEGNPLELRAGDKVTGVVAGSTKDSRATVTLDRTPWELKPGVLAVTDGRSMTALYEDTIRYVR